MNVTIPPSTEVDRSAFQPVFREVVEVGETSLHPDRRGSLHREGTKRKGSDGGTDLGVWGRV